MHRLKIREIAERKGLSRTRLSRLSELDYETINTIWNNDHQDVRLSTLIKLSQALQVDITELFEVIDAWN